MQQILGLALAGALGTLSRFGLSGIVQRFSGADFPIGTLAVNIIGSIIIGFIMHLGLNTDLIPDSLRVVVTIGFLGAFTTFSTFSYETVRYIDQGAWLLGAANIAANVGLSLMATFLGMTLGKIIFGGA